jgi:hypothetical protein
MNPEERKNHCYLGDGVYAEKTDFHIILRTGSHRDEDCDNKIYLEGHVLNNLSQCLDHWEGKAVKEKHWNN